jgi:hypothetical protein
MVVFRSIAIALVILLSVEYALAFKIGAHVEATVDALKNMVQVWPAPAELQKWLKDKWFSKMAIQQIANANIAKDAGDCPDAVPNPPAKPCNVIPVPIEVFNIDIGIWAGALVETALERQLPVEHFDRELIEAGNIAVIDNRSKVIEALKKRDWISARRELGGVLHSIQDFYAHSNYVELLIDSSTPIIDIRLGASKTSFASGRPRVAGPGDLMCIDGGLLLTKADLSSIMDLQKTLTAVELQRLEKSLADPPLTTGYFWTISGNVAPLAGDESLIKQYHKCAHSLVLRDGIDKDSGDHPLHASAKRHAYLHTLNFVSGILTEMKDDPTAILGLMGHPILTSSNPFIVNPGGDAFELYVYGSDFTDSSKVLWNGRPRDTTFVDSKTLKAAITKADIAQPATVPVSVSNDSYDSNTLDFIVGGKPCDCPAPVANQHAHDDNYPDVNAKKWNDTGLVVKAGDRIEFKVLEGRIVWRSGLLFDESASPIGDSRATPANTLLWIDPQIPISTAPVGALIGMILDPAAGGQLTEKPDGATYIPILTGGRNCVLDRRFGIATAYCTMPADGRLYLGVNDGRFGNNEGCFQVGVTRLRR